MVSRKRNKGKARRALKAEKERVAKAEAEAERAKVAEAEVLESAAVGLSERKQQPQLSASLLKTQSTMQRRTYSAAMIFPHMKLMMRERR
eukprot:scaffold1933_cov145-Skeletonema_dohrnii-CCMP3373.AAC.4